MSWKLGRGLPRVVVVACGLGALGVGTTSRTGNAQTVPLVSGKRVVSPPDHCKWTASLPALPAACNGKAPTLANCVDSTYIKGACGSTPAVKNSYCQKLLLEDFCSAGNTFEELVSAGAGLAATALDPSAQLYEAPRAGKRGRQVPAGIPGAMRPAGLVASYDGISQHSGALQAGAWDFTLNSKGTFETTVAPIWIAKYNTVRPQVVQAHRNFVATGASAVPGSLLTILAGPYTPWVGNGSATPANLIVNSCGEYTYQRWYDVVRFRDAARSLGRDYRAIYELATNPSSPVYIEKATLGQFGSGTIPKAWPQRKELPRNIFFTARPSLWHNVPEAKKNAILQRWERFNTKRTKVDRGKTIEYYEPVPIRLTGLTSTKRFELHRQLRNKIEAAYQPSDGAFEQAQVRQDRYATLVIQRERVAEALACANEPALCCPVPPAPVTSGTKVQIISKAKGWIYSNPDPTRALLAENRIRYFDYSNEFNMLEQIAVQQQLRVVGGVLNGVDGKLPAGGAVRSSTFSPPPTPSASTIGKGNPGAKQMAGIDLGSMTRTKPIGGLGLSEVNAAGLNCLDAWKAQKATLQIGLNTINSRLSSLIVSEFDDPKGCLADPGGVGGNICDWSYEKFAGEVLSFGEEDMQADFSLCNAATGGNFQEVRNQSLQKKVWPCELRQDFGIDQRNAAYYFDIRGDQVARFACEKERVKENLADYLKSWREVTKNIPVRETWVGESAGDKWQIGKKSTFGARLEYGVGWYVKGGAGGKRTGDNAWCKPIGEGSLTAKAALDFFGKELTVVDAAVVQTTKEAEATFRAHAMYRDFNKLSKTELTPLFPKIDAKLTEPRTFPLSQKLIGKVSYSMGFSVGPAVITVTFGVQAMAGLELKALGRPSATQCDSPPGNSETLSYNFSTGVEFEPFAQADVFAQAALELGIARGGVRVNVTLLRLGLPTGAAAEIEKGTEMSLRTGSSLAVRALSGSISAFVEVGICPLCGDREATLFSWRGLRQDIPLWGRRAGPFPVKVATLFADSNVTDANVECINKQNTGSLNASGIMLVGNTPATSVPIDRWWCLRTMHDKNACIPYGNAKTLPQDSKAAGRACAPLYTPLVGSQR